MPGVPRLGRMRGGGEHVVEVVVEHPVLLGVELEVLDALGDRMLSPEAGDLHGVRQVVVLRRMVDEQLRAPARVGGELPADQLQVVG